MNGCLAIGLFFMGIALLFIHPVIGGIFRLFNVWSGFKGKGFGGQGDRP